MIVVRNALACLRALWERLKPVGLPSPDDFGAWRRQLGQWANERRSEIVIQTWHGERE